MPAPNARFWASLLLNKAPLPLDILRTHAVQKADIQLSSIAAKPDFADQMDMLSIELAGQNALLLIHAGLISLIRRQIDLEINLERFHGLWREYQDLLLSSMSLRWLVSALDTFADHAEAPNEAELAILGSLLLNTVKLYETERRFLAPSDSNPSARVAISKPPPVMFDGVTAFAVGRGDMPRNLLHRLSQHLNQKGVVTVILREVIGRVLINDTAWHRLCPVEAQTWRSRQLP